MNREQFARVTASAYVDQFSSDGSPVMNDRIIVYDFDSERFGSQSSLTPVFDNEIVVASLELGCFGSDLDADDVETEQAIYTFILDRAMDDWWNEIVATIEEQD